jgi:hypothetical protein
MPVDSPIRVEHDDRLALSLAWFPAEDYARAIEQWPSIAEDWADIPHQDYCHEFERNLRTYAPLADVMGVAPLRLGEYLAWCESEEVDPEDAASRARYAADLTRRGGAVSWPPRRNDRCWCGSGRKYKQCCGALASA